MYILASMSPDMIEDIIELCNSRGRAIISDINGEDGPARPLAMFSRDFIDNADFPAVYSGLMITVLGELRALHMDQDFYEKTLMKAFSIPGDMARKIAKDIETHDPIDSKSQKDLPWYKDWFNRISETIRQGVNWVPSILNIPIENDQNQSFDLDCLFELKLLGEAADRLGSRFRLMKGQAAINVAFGTFESEGYSKGDIFENPVESAEVQLTQDAKPLMGAVLPDLIFGGLKKLFQIGHSASKAKMQNNLSSAGVNDSGNISDPAMKAALDNLRNGTPSSSISQMDGSSIPVSTVNRMIDALVDARQNGKTGDTYDQVTEQYGDAVATQWRHGNIPAMLAEVVELAGDSLETTGDPELDQAIVQDTLNQTAGTYGDIAEDLDTEMGGLFKRARINANIRKSSRRDMKASRKAGKIAAKRQKNQTLIDSRMRRVNSGIINDPEYSDEDYLNPDPNQGNQLDESAYFDNGEFDNPDDPYNLNQFEP
jgi:hypothetical protein